MPLYKVEIIEERESFAFVRAASPAAARARLMTAALDGEVDWIDGTSPTYVVGETVEISAVPIGYELDFAAEEEDTDA